MGFGFRDYGFLGILIGLGLRDEDGWIERGS